MADGVPEYEELKLRIEPGPGGSYRVLAFAPDGSTAAGTFTPPFTETELDNFVLRVGLPRRSVRRYRSSQMEQAKQFGSRLAEALIKGDVHDVFEGARRQAAASDRGLRITLYLTGVPELMEIPWEFLYKRPAFFSQSIYTPLVRSLDLKDAPPPRKVSPPLRILAVVSAPEGYETLNVDQEREKIDAAVSDLVSAGLVEIHWLERSTLLELERVIGAPDEFHVLHYVGHGAYDERSLGGILVLEDARGLPHEVTGEELGSLLHDERSLQLVVLNSCEGARSSHVDPFSGVAASLLEYGIPAAIGMQFEITDRAAVTFAGRLYGALVQSFPIDAALAQARKAIFADGNDIEFGTPVLFLRAANARLFDVQANGRSLATKTARPVGDISVRIEQRPADPGPEDPVTWELTVENSGSSKLAEVTALEADGKALAAPVELAPGERHTVRWKDRNEPEPLQLITVTASDSGGSRISKQITVPPRTVGPREKELPPARPERTEESEGGRRRIRGRIAAIAAVAVLLLSVGVIVLFAGGDEEAIAGRVVGEPIPVGKKPQDIVAGEGAAWVTSLLGSVTQIEPSTGDPTTIELGEFDVPVPIVAGEGAVWVIADINQNRLTRIDPETREVRKIRVPEYGTVGQDLAVGQGGVWILDTKGEQVIGVDAETESVSGPIPVSDRPVGIAAGGGWVYVSHKNGEVDHIDPRSMDKFRPVKLANDDLGSGISYADGVLYAFQGKNTAVSVDVDSGVRGKPIELGRGASSFEVLDGSMWVTYPVEGEVARIELPDGRQVGERLAVGGSPELLAIGEDFVWVARDDGTVVKVDPTI